MLAVILIALAVFVIGLLIGGAAVLLYIGSGFTW